MQKIILAVVLAFAAHCSCAFAATPTFQLAPNPVWISGLPDLLELNSDGTLSATEGVDSAIQPDADMLVATAAPGAFSAPIKFADFTVVQEAAFDRADIFRSVNFLDGSDSGRGATQIFTDQAFRSGALYVFLKDLNTRSHQKSERWALLLIALCFVLYWSRRRPVRTFLRLHPESEARRNRKM